MDYQSLLSNRVLKVKPSGIRRFFDIATDMADVLSLSIGEPDFVTPARIREAGIAALRDGHTYYTANAGMPLLREEICNTLLRRFSLQYNANEEILVTIGGSEAIDNIIRALVNFGDEVLIPEPTFVCYAPMTTFAGGTPVPIKTFEKDKFRLTPEALKSAITNKTKLLILPYPSNPTGGIMEQADLEAIADVLRPTNILVLADEIYADLTYGLPHFSFARIPDMKERTIVVNGFSKAYAMTGWRLGYAAGPAEIMQHITKIHQFAIMSAPTISQLAAIVALKYCDDDIEHMKSEYDKRRKFIVEGLRTLGLSCFEPQGAFYVFPSIQTTGLSSEEFCERLLFSKQVAVIPGNAFGESGEGFIRISYASSIEKIECAIEKISEFLKELPK